jgi:alanine or glycine:cation symporter, AGCS family
MHAFETFLTQLNDLVWGVPMLVMILSTGLYLTVRLQFMPIRKIGLGFRLLFKSPASSNGEISPFSALMTSLSATVGIGNIAGVATAICLGGPGALFWMWMTAFVGMATKYAETVLAIQFREKTPDGRYQGGPMYYIQNGMGQQWRWLAIAFAVFGTVAGFGIGNMVQSNSVAEILHNSFHIETWVSGVVMTVITGIVIIGGVKRIATAADALVPLMCIVYLLAGLLVLALHWDQVPAAVALVFGDAFTGTAASGGFAGSTIWLAMRWGVARGIFSNEAGLGSAPIAHAAVQTDNAVQQGLVGMLGTFIDTIVVCSVTGIAIVVTGVWNSGLKAAALSTSAFAAAFPGGEWVVPVVLPLFAFTTILGWSYYGERCLEYLAGARSIFVFRLCWVAAVYVGAVLKLELVWTIADTLNAMMALPNLIALLVLSPLVIKMTRDYFSEKARQS